MSYDDTDNHGFPEGWHPVADEPILFDHVEVWLLERRDV